MQSGGTWVKPENVLGELDNLEIELIFQCMIDSIVSALGDKAKYLLNHQSATISKDKLHLPGPDFIDRIFHESRRRSCLERPDGFQSTHPTFYRRALG